MKNQVTRQPWFNVFMVSVLLVPPGFSRLAWNLCLLRCVPWLWRAWDFPCWRLFTYSRLSCGTRSLPGIWQPARSFFPHPLLLLRSRQWNRRVSKRVEIDFWLLFRTYSSRSAHWYLCYLLHCFFDLLFLLLVSLLRGLAFRCSNLGKLLSYKGF